MAKKLIEETAEEIAAEPVKKGPAVKASVTVTFRDKCTGEVHHVGDVIEVPKKRFDEINRKGAYLRRI